jgi:hypothetical protein
MVNVDTDSGELDQKLNHFLLNGQLSNFRVSSGNLMIANYGKKITKLYKELQSKLLFHKAFIRFG